MKTFLQLLCVLGVLCGSGFSQDREAFTITRWQLDVQIVPGEGALAASGTLAVRNDSPAPQNALALQISSGMQWQSVQQAGKPLAFTVRELRSDYDHTGRMSEAVIQLPAPIAKGGTAELEVGYSGTIALDARRLTEAKCPGCAAVPLDVAEASDWDRIETGYSIFRGAGYVTWYPIAIAPQPITYPRAFFDQLAAWRARHGQSVLSADLCVRAEMPVGFTIVASGTPRAVAASSTRAKCAGYDFALTGDRVPVVAAATFGVVERPHATAYYLEERPRALDVLAAFERAEKYLEDWFTPRAKSAIVQLPGAKIGAFESGSFSATPFDTRDPLLLQTNAARQIAHASFASPRLWLDEGVAQLAQVLLRESAGGRKAALDFMNTRAAMLAEIEHQLLDSDDELRGDALLLTHNDVLVRVKGMFVFSMLRDLAGDDALRRALAAYRPADDKQADYFQQLLERESKKDLAWFFNDWVYRDRGLPEFKIVNTLVRPTLRDTFTVVVTVENTGGATAEVPVAVQTAGGEKSERLRVPAHDKATARITVPAAPTGVTVNDGSVPEEDRSNNSAPVTLPANGQGPTTKDR
ncbi:MAG TPA: hypothetical protein VLA96_01530 [Terriglobales bacterium]|nr:hypothetical protein [Terriglobales bacterium]